MLVCDAHTHAFVPNRVGSGQHPLRPKIFSAHPNEKRCCRALLSWVVHTAALFCFGVSAVRRQDRRYLSRCLLKYVFFGSAVRKQGPRCTFLWLFVSFLWERTSNQPFWSAMPASRTPNAPPVRKTAAGSGGRACGGTLQAPAVQERQVPIRLGSGSGSDGSGGATGNLAGEGRLCSSPERAKPSVLKCLCFTYHFGSVCCQPG